MILSISRRPSPVRSAVTHKHAIHDNRSISAEPIRKKTQLGLRRSWSRRVLRGLQNRLGDFALINASRPCSAISRKASPARDSETGRRLSRRLSSWKEHARGLRIGAEPLTISARTKPRESPRVLESLARQKRSPAETNPSTAASRIAHASRPSHPQPGDCHTMDAALRHRLHSLLRQKLRREPAGAGPDAFRPVSFPVFASQ